MAHEHPGYGRNFGRLQSIPVLDHFAPGLPGIRPAICFMRVMRQQTLCQGGRPRFALWLRLQTARALTRTDPIKGGSKLLLSSH